MSSENQCEIRERNSAKEHGKKMTRNYLRLFCPDCGEICRMRTSTEIDPLLKKGYVQCQNIECGYRGVVHVEHVARLSVTGNEKDVRIPYSESIKRHAQLALIPGSDQEKQ